MIQSPCLQPPSKEQSEALALLLGWQIGAHNCWWRDKKYKDEGKHWPPCSIHMNGREYEAGEDSIFAKTAVLAVQYDTSHDPLWSWYE